MKGCWASSSIVLVLGLGLVSCQVADSPVEKRVIDIKGAVGPYSSGIVVGDTLHVSGQIGVIPGERTIVEGGFEAEVHQVLQNLAAIVGKAGFALEDVVSCTVYLTDVALYGEFNKVYQEYFERPFPARACVAVKELVLDSKVEVSCIAVKGTEFQQ